MTVPESYQFCERVARREAKNFYYSFLLLPRGRRRAMCAIYAFMRYCDDLSDSGNAAGRASAIAAWKADLEAALGGETPAHAVWPAFKDTVARYRIPHQYFYDMIEGVSSDLEPRRFETFEQLYGYCYRVASVVGLTIIHIFGFQSPAALLLAEQCGIAFQLTNSFAMFVKTRRMTASIFPRKIFGSLAWAPCRMRSRRSGEICWPLRPRAPENITGLPSRWQEWLTRVAALLFEP